MDANSTITLAEGYRAMFAFLDTHWERNREARTNDDIGALLDLMQFHGPEPVDPTKWDDWLTAVKAIKA